MARVVLKTLRHTRHRTDGTARSVLRRTCRSAYAWRRAECTDAHTQWVSRLKGVTDSHARLPHVCRKSAATDSRQLTPTNVIRGENDLQAHFSPWVHEIRLTDRHPRWEPRTRDSAHCCCTWPEIGARSIWRPASTQNVVRRNDRDPLPGDPEAAIEPLP